MSFCCIPIIDCNIMTGDATKYEFRSWTGSLWDDRNGCTSIDSKYWQEHIVALASVGFWRWSFRLADWLCTGHCAYFSAIVRNNISLWSRSNSNVRTQFRRILCDWRVACISIAILCLCISATRSHEKHNKQTNCGLCTDKDVQFHTDIMNHICWVNEMLNDSNISV